jgi:hypothetical protein
MSRYGTRPGTILLRERIGNLFFFQGRGGTEKRRKQKEKVPAQDRNSGEPTNGEKRQKKKDPMTDR